MRQDRFLLGLLGGIVLLIVLAIGLFFVRQGTLDYLDEDSPESIVHNYIFAFQQEDYARAYGYLSDAEGKPTQTEFLAAMADGYNRLAEAGVQIINTEIIDNPAGDKTAVVEIVVGRDGGGDLFSSSYRYEDSALLVMEDGKWKITRMPYPYWEYNWYSQDF